MLGEIQTGSKSFTEPKAVFLIFTLTTLTRVIQVRLTFLKVQTKIPLKSLHDSLCCYKYDIQNAALAQHVSHRAWQGYIAHATA